MMLMKKIHFRTGIPVEAQFLTNGLRPMLPGSLLSTFCLVNHSTLQLSLRLLGGAGSRTVPYWTCPYCTYNNEDETFEYSCEACKRKFSSSPTSKRTKFIYEAEDDRKLPALQSENEEEESDDEGESAMYDSEDEESADEDASAMYENDEDESDDDVEIYASDEDISADASNMSESDVVDTIQVKSLTPSHIIVATDELAEAMIQFSE